MYMQQSKSLKINKSVIDNPVMKRNPSQKRAIAHLSGPMMVLAGPGSGKTSVIVERTAHMIQEGKIPASSVLVVTFFQGSSSGNERTVSEIYRCSANRRYFRDFSRSVLRDPQTGLWSEWRKYPVPKKKNMRS